MYQREWQRSGRTTVEQPLGGGGGGARLRACKGPHRRVFNGAGFHVGQGGGDGGADDSDDGEGALGGFLFSRHRVNVGLNTAANNKRAGGRERAGGKQKASSGSDAPARPAAA